MTYGQVLEPHPRAISRLLTTAIITFILTTASWAASKETVLYTFQGGSDGDFSMAGLISDAKAISTAPPTWAAIPILAPSLNSLLTKRAVGPRPPSSAFRGFPSMDRQPLGPPGSRRQRQSLRHYHPRRRRRRWRGHGLQANANKARLMERNHPAYLRLLLQ